ncbi:hypothetical protein Hte_006028 [Hypoxylon texense]
MLGFDEAEEEEAAYESVCIFLLELDQPVWYNIARETFVRLQKLFATAFKAAWSRGELSCYPSSASSIGHCGFSTQSPTRQCSLRPGLKATTTR